METTLLVHGVPRGSAGPLARELGEIIQSEGAHPCLIGVVDGEPVVGLDEEELERLLSAEHVEKANTANLGVLMHRGVHGATTVSTTMELAARAGVKVFATGAIGGVHEGYGTALDISSDLAALARFPVAVVTSGVKSILDVESTREALETLGIPVVGFGTDVFPAFYRRGSGAGVDARFDDVSALRGFVRSELARTGRGVVVANPIPEGDELGEADWSRWVEAATARARAEGARGRGVTPAVLGALHEISGGATLRANLALVKCNARLGAQIV
jgi:pseudouridine-5'-phosphate glycosidase